jgi:hypothetical protein
VNSDGTVVSGDAFAGDVGVEGSTTTNSTINGCDIGQSCGQSPVPPQTVGAESILGPVGLMQSPANQGGQKDQSEDQDEKEGGSKKTSADPSVYLINTGPLQLDDVIDDPITSGNDGLAGPQ